VSLLRRLGAGWMRIVARFGDVQTLVLLALFYAFLIGPASLISSAARKDMLHKRALPAGEPSAWDEADTGGHDLERAKLQS
jgi:hypothetical protein